MNAKSLMIQGTASNVGKSLLVAGYCRLFSRMGYKVAPFKAQNMALNSFVTPDGLEMGRAQALQAQAAFRDPDIRMNPVLLKPEAHQRSQIVLMGKPLKTAAGSLYYRERNNLWGYVTASLDSLQKENDLIIIEGAGSPAEINLKKSEIVNMRVAGYLNAPVLLAVDVDQGGSFAFLYGTLNLLEPHEQKLIRGFLFNKFRGDVELLKPGLEMLSDLTGGRPALGVIPMIPGLKLAQEDSVFIESRRIFGTGRTDIAVINYPLMSNYDDFDALTLEEDLQIRFVSSREELGNPDAILLPGSKSTLKDLQWLKETSLASIIKEKAAAGISVGGVCGGFQMMGQYVEDPDGIEGPAGSERGLEILPLNTIIGSEKRTEQVHMLLAEDRSKEIGGYEIHMGQSFIDPGTNPLFIDKDTGENEGISLNSGRMWGSYLHGIFDDPAFRRAWLSRIGWNGGRKKPLSLAEARESELDRLADEVEKHSQMSEILKITGL